ncbi:MAG: TIGR03905 family TSCPD domain-containing protein [Desulfobacteraceae bacterium]|nr:TIGR03905 family TSCPD domain-containing protein [Desulfobacteraceae bacterium]
MRQPVGARDFSVIPVSGIKGLMTSTLSARRFIFHTQGVCPPEIHFNIDQDRIHAIRFMGGGCPGNAELVGQLLEGRHIDEVLTLTEGLDCRNNTSCPDQLARAIDEALRGKLLPVARARVHSDPETRSRMGIIGDLNGDADTLRTIISDMRDHGVESIVCAGNLGGDPVHLSRMISIVRDENLHLIFGEQDRFTLGRPSPAGLPQPDQENLEWLRQRPHMFTADLGGYQIFLFYGDYVQNILGFSDFDPYALEINMVCGLTRFMEDESVFPALAAMTPQFTADVIIFGQKKIWRRWQVGGKTIISAGPATSIGHPCWGLLHHTTGELKFREIQAGA